MISIPVFNARKNRVLPAIAVIASIFLLIGLWKGGAVQAIKHSLLSTLEYIEDHKTFGALLYVILFAISCNLLLPASLLTLAAGVIFKPVVWGILLVLIGSQLALILAIVLGRTVLKPFVESYKKKSPFMKALDKALAREGFKIVLLVRFSPVAPFGIANYMFSVTSIPLPMLQFATFLGNIPGAATYTILGSYIGSLSGISDGGSGGGNKDTEFGPRTKMLGALVSGVIMVWTVVYIGVVARGALRLATARNGPEEDEVVSELESGNSANVHIERAPLMPEEEEPSTSWRRQSLGGRSSDLSSITSPMSISDASSELEGPIDVNGYTAEDRMLIKRTAWTLGGVLCFGIVVILTFIPSE
ncbi:hypothetical protein HDU79_010353 [Rhizoclosmatium sp. JEL0117]|nr:hypothetical protein HDU99_009693 [Rhizoclosmatium hyalinum]KAJ3294839.1 hypothetical protein HDU79_010347 [Rhizoclosmatium sp. JEL0117]KAJ3294845.1 hypothetical protein HDU79_010353 [Rhizoclosmatium sp. JEL0117]